MPCLNEPTWSKGTSGWSRESGRAWITLQVPQKGAVAILLPKKGSIFSGYTNWFWAKTYIQNPYIDNVGSSFQFKDSPTKPTATISWIVDATRTDVQIKQVFNATQKGFKRQARFPDAQWGRCQRVPAEVVLSNYLHFVWNPGHFWNCKHLRGSTHTAAKHHGIFWLSGLCIQKQPSSADLERTWVLRNNHISSITMILFTAAWIKLVTTKELLQYLCLEKLWGVHLNSGLIVHLNGRGVHPNGWGAGNLMAQALFPTWEGDAATLNETLMPKVMLGSPGGSGSCHQGSGRGQDPRVPPRKECSGPPQSPLSMTQYVRILLASAVHFPIPVLWSQKGWSQSPPILGRPRRSSQNGVGPLALSETSCQLGP